MRTLWWGAAIALWAGSLVLARPLPAQSPYVADLLHAITVQVTAVSPRGSSVLCHGFVEAVHRGIAYVVTARHCVETSNGTALTPTTTPAVTVTYVGGGRGEGRWLFWTSAHDLLVVAASFDRLPVSYAAACPECVAYRAFGPWQRIPVMSVLSVGGSSPVVSSGFVVTDAQGRALAILPASPGTSGAAVLDLRGNLAGTVVSGYLPRATDAGWLVNIVPGALVLDLVHYAVSQTEAGRAVPTPRVVAPGEFESPFRP